MSGPSQILRFGPAQPNAALGSLSVFRVGRTGGREKLLALGEWPHTSAKRARERRDEVRRLLADGIEPAAKRKAERQAVTETFSALAREYLDTERSSLNPKTLSKAEWLLEDWLNKYVGKIPVPQIAASDILSVCRRIEAKGRYETAHRARAFASRVMRYGVITGRVDRDPCSDLRGALTPVKTLVCSVFVLGAAAILVSKSGIVSMLTSGSA